MLMNPTAISNTIIKSGYLRISDSSNSSLYYIFIGKIGVSDPSKLENIPLII